jgi:hypothetical protein
MISIITPLGQGDILNIESHRQKYVPIDRAYPLRGHYEAGGKEQSNMSLRAERSNMSLRAERSNQMQSIDIRCGRSDCRVIYPLNTFSDLA